MKKKVRTVNFYEMAVSTLPGNGVKVEPTQEKFESVLQVLQQFLKKEQLFGSKSSAVELVDFKCDSGNLFLLINKVNPDLPEIGFYKTSTGKRRKPLKDDDEHREQSAHVMIEPRRGTNLARVKITVGAGVSAGKAKQILASTFDNHKESAKLKTHRRRIWPTNVESDDGQKKDFYVNYKFTINTEPSEFLKDILGSKKIVELDLIDPSDMSLDGTNLHIAKRTFTIAGNIPKSVDGIRGILKSAKQGSHNIDVSQLKLVYEEEESEEAFEARRREGGANSDVRQTVKKIKTIKASELEQAFTRSEKIYLQDDHPETQNQLSQQLMDGLKSL